MQKIKSEFDQKDRVVCVTVQGSHEFYYQPVGSKERILLFVTDYSGSVFAYFRDRGRCMGGRGFSLTINEIYKEKSYHKNIRLNHIIERIPMMINYVLRERLQPKEADKKIIVTREEAVCTPDREDRELAA